MSENFKNIEVLLDQAYAHFSKEEWDEAINKQSRALSLAESDSSSTDELKAHIYFIMGITYGIKREYRTAIDKILSSIGLNNFNADAHVSLGFTYYKNEQYKESLEYYRKANSINPRLKLENSLCYLASRIYSMEMLPHIFELYTVIREIKQERFYNNALENSNLISHYTNLNSLRSLVQKNPFRLYNVTYMSDPSEGKALLARLEGYDSTNNIAKIEGFLSESTRSPAYVGSFVKKEAGEHLEDNEIFRWCTYGKHNLKEAGGACLHFDISHFSEHPPQELDFFYPEKNMKSSIASHPEQKAYIYKIAYKDDMESESLSLSLDVLKDLLDKIKVHQWDNNNPDHLLAREILDEIRFLFKANQYRGETELRIVKIRHFSDELPEDVKVDMDKLPPRFYMEAPNQLQLKKVILGPQAKAFAGWARWIKTANSKLEVEQSDIPYGTDYSDN